MFSTMTIINFNILISYQTNTISVEPQIQRMKVSAQEFCLVCFLHHLLSPKRSLISLISLISKVISINLSFLFYLLGNTNWLFNTARLHFLLRLLGHLTDKHNSTNCFKITVSKLSLPTVLASKSKATEATYHHKDLT